MGKKKALSEQMSARTSVTLHRLFVRFPPRAAYEKPNSFLSPAAEPYVLSFIQRRPNGKTFETDTYYAGL